MYHLDAIGIASFGPICVNSSKVEYGCFFKTPKLGWNGFNIKRAIERVTKTSVFIDTDVNCACIGEMYYGASSELRDLAYITVGTGIGVGVIVNRKPLHGMLHPEVGHIYVRPVEGDLFEGCCPFHGFCVEGMASGKAIEKRTGKKGEELLSKDRIWQFESKYLAQLVNSVMVSFSPQRILLGGGVMDKPGLLEMVRKDVELLNNGYYPIDTTYREYLCRPSLNGNQALFGAYALTQYPELRN